MEGVKKMTTDEILENLSWVVDRGRYCRVCGKKQPAGDAYFEHVLLGELSKREGWEKAV